MNINKKLRESFDSLKALNLSYWTEKTGSKSAAMWRMRNAAIDGVVRDWVDSYPEELFYPELIEDRATSEDRAQHYGVKIGDVINTYYLARDDYNSLLAAFKAQVRSETLGIIW